MWFFVTGVVASRCREDGDGCDCIVLALVSLLDRPTLPTKRGFRGRKEVFFRDGIKGENGVCDKNLAYSDPNLQHNKIQCRNRRKEREERSKVEQNRNSIQINGRVCVSKRCLAQCLHL